MKGTPIIAIVAIVLLLGIALLKEINGTLLAGGIAVIAGLAGYTVGRKPWK